MRFKKTIRANNVSGFSLDSEVIPENLGIDFVIHNFKLYSKT